MADERKYFVKEGWVFNLESMHDKLFCIGIDIDECRIQTPIDILGYKIEDSSDLQPLMDECSDLEWAAKSRKVTGKEYGRIKDIVAWRAEQRYFTCLASGMEEQKAAGAFEDL